MQPALRRSGKSNAGKRRRGPGARARAPRGVRRRPERAHRDVAETTGARVATARQAGFTLVFAKLGARRAGFTLGFCFERTFEEAVMTFQTGVSSTHFLGSLLHALCVPPSNKSAFTEQKTHRRHTEVRNTLVFLVLNTKISLHAIQAELLIFTASHTSVL